MVWFGFKLTGTKKKRERERRKNTTKHTLRRHLLSCRDDCLCLFQCLCQFGASSLQNVHSHPSDHSVPSLATSIEFYFLGSCTTIERHNLLYVRLDFSFFLRYSPQMFPFWIYLFIRFSFFFEELRFY